MPALGIDRRPVERDCKRERPRSERKGAESPGVAPVLASAFVPLRASLPGANLGRRLAPVVFLLPCPC